MGKLRPLSGQAVCAILKKAGFTKIRQWGSHIIMQKEEDGSTMTVPVPDHRELKPGTLSSIIRQSGLAREKFE